MYIRISDEMCIIAVYVDDIILATEKDESMKEIKTMIASKFSVKDMGELHHFLGVKVIQNKKSGEIWMGQSTYAKDLLVKWQIVSQLKRQQMLEQS